VEGFREFGDLVGHALLFLEREEPVVVEELHKVTAQAMVDNSTWVLPFSVDSMLRWSSTV